MRTVGLSALGSAFIGFQDAIILGPAVHVIMLGSTLCRERKRTEYMSVRANNTSGIFRHRNENSIDTHVDAS